MARLPQLLPVLLFEFYEDMHVELYHLDDDIGETADLAAEKPELAGTLRARLHRWRTEVGAQMPRPKADGRIE